MPVCPKCHKFCKTAQGLGGHMRFRHQMTIPKQSLQVYAQDRIEKAEAEASRLREQLARSQKRSQDLETFYEKKVEEQNAQMAEMQRKTAGFQVESLKQNNEQSRLQQSLAEERAVLQKQAEEFRKQIEGLEMRKTQVKELAEKQLKELAEKQNQRSLELEKRLNQVEKQEPKQSGVEALRNELEQLKSQMAQNSCRRQSFSLLPPKPDLLHPTDSIRSLEQWLNRFNH